MSESHRFPTGAELIAAERRRQVVEEGWTAEHGAGHQQPDALLMAAYCYLNDLVYGGFREPPVLWPWAAKYWKPEHGDAVSQLVKTGALIAAEIDRLQDV